MMLATPEETSVALTVSITPVEVLTMSKCCSVSSPNRLVLVNLADSQIIDSEALLVILN